MAPLQSALDVSNYSGVVSPAQARCFREQGFEHLVAGTQVASVTRTQLEAALAAGMSVDAYVYLYWRRDVVAEVRRSVAAVEGLPIGRIWIDCEDDYTGIGAEALLDAIARAVDACAPHAAGIYTGRWWWPGATGNSDRFSHLPLWHAEYTAGPDAPPNFDHFAPYGGWTRPAMWQYQGTTSVCGVTVDLNLREVPAPVPVAAAEGLELALLRAAQRFDRARALGHYVFRPVIGAPGIVELQRVEAGAGVSFDPPYLLPVE